MPSIPDLPRLVKQSVGPHLPPALRRVLRRLRDRAARAGSPAGACGRPRWVTLQAASEALHRQVLSALLPDDHAALSLLDVGCGHAPVTRTFGCRDRTFLDAVRPDSPPEPFVQADAVEFLRADGRSYDLIYCLDMIEHLDRPVGEALLALATRRAARLAVFFTPLGPMLLNPSHPLGHRSGWWPEEFEALGYQTWAFPRFHDPWEDGMVWGEFYAWKWMRAEPGPAARLASLAAGLGLTVREAELMREGASSAADDERAGHWRRLRELYRPRLFPLPEPRRP